MKIIVATFLLICLQAPTPRQAANHGSHDRNSKNAATKGGSPPTRPIPAQHPADSNPSEKESQEISSNDKDSPVRVRVLYVNVNKNWSDYLYIGASLLVAIATLVLARIAWIQAKAAKASADALYVQTRPWIFLAKETTIPASPPSDWKFEWVLKNYGKTPAKIIWSHVEVQTGNSDSHPENTSVFGKPAYSFPFMLPPEGVLQRTERLPMPWDSEEIMQGKKYLWLCGYVVYSDAAELSDAAPYETLFCFRYHRGWATQKPSWVRSGPREYNRTT